MGFGDDGPFQENLSAGWWVLSSCWLLCVVFGFFVCFFLIDMYLFVCFCLFSALSLSSSMTLANYSFPLK